MLMPVLSQAAQPEVEAPTELEVNVPREAAEAPMMPAIDTPASTATRGDLGRRMIS